MEGGELKWKRLDWRGRFLVWTSAVSIAGLAIEVYGQAHYAAADDLRVDGFIVLLAMRAGCGDGNGTANPLGSFAFARAIPLTCVLMLALRAAAGTHFHIDTGPNSWPPTWYNSDSRKLPRDGIEKGLEKVPGKSLVLVSYKAQGNSDTPHEWIYNAADIDSAKIVWAWDMGPAKNQELIDYFNDRQVWKIEVSEIPSR